MAESSLPYPIISRKDARAQGLDKYFTNKVCKHGHIAQRYIHGSCVDCTTMHVNKHRAENPDCRKEESRKYREKYPEKRKETCDRYYQNNKEEVLERQAARYKENPDMFLGWGRKWRKANPEKVNAAARRRRKANPEKAKAFEKSQREKHREKIKERMTSWRERNKDHERSYGKRYERERRDRAKVLARVLRWAKGNPEKHLALTHKRRARVLGAEGTYTPEDIQAILASQNGLCVGINCGKDISKRFTIDHILPLVRGGSNWPANLQILCRKCNSRKNKRTMEEWRAAELSA